MHNKLFFSIGVIAIVFIGAVVLKTYTDVKVKEANEKSLLAIEAQVAKQDQLVAQVADLTRTSGADAITEKIIVDCSAGERARFDTLLDKLSQQISPDEIRELDGLFYKCARFYADRKSVMAARLVREVEVFAEYSKLYRYIKNVETDTTENRALLWKQVAEAEMKLATHFNDLVRLQGDIITALLNGQTKDSVDIKNTLVEVSAARDQMTMLTKQIENFQIELRAI